MAKDINNVIERLLKASKDLSLIYDTLSILTGEKKENTSFFKSLVGKAESLMNTETIVLNNLDENETRQIYDMLPQFDDDSAAYVRTHEIIEAKLCGFMTADIEEMESVEIGEIDENAESVDEYFVLDLATTKYEIPYSNYVDMVALKGLKKRILETPTDNDQDRKFKTNLLNYLDAFKFVVCIQNHYIEKVALQYNYDVDQMPNLSQPNLKLDVLAYNFCVEFLVKLYNPHLSYDTIYDTVANLYNMLRYETYLANVDDENIPNLVKICKRIERESSNRFYGEYAKNKLLTRTKN